MTNVNHGQRAEAVAADYLQKLGFEILDRNWRTRLCEIDIIAQKRSVLYFVEVKYRQSHAQGGGFEYITPRKLEQMQFAAETWQTDYERDNEYHLSAIEVAGDDYLVQNFIESITS